MRIKMDKTDGEPITVVFDKNHISNFSTILLGGKLTPDDDGDEFPCGSYVGSCDPSNVAFALVHTLRTAIRINRYQHDMTPSESFEFIVKCLTNAMDLEVEEKI
jgi:hypothetical protein